MLSDDPITTIPFQSPQPFGVWGREKDTALFQFHPHCQVQMALQFEADTPLRIILGEQSQVKIIESLPQVHYQLHSGAKLFHQDSGFSHTLQFELESQAQLFHVNATRVSTDVIRAIDVILKGEKASVQWLASVGIQDTKYTETFTMEHQSPYSQSNYELRSAIEGRGALCMACDVTLQSDARHAIALQKNLNYILTPYGRVTAQPRLHVFNRNVEASHGTATQPIPQEALFYLQSRGLSLSEAQKLFIESFLGLHHGNE